MNTITRSALYLGCWIVAASVVISAAAGSTTAPTVTSTKFAGPKANTGTVTYTATGNTHTLTLSADFVVPDTPDPHWQVVDTQGRVYQLDKLMLKGDRVARTITLPGYIGDVKKVVIWCAWAEANLGEASFTSPVRLR